MSFLEKGTFPQLVKKKKKAKEKESCLIFLQKFFLNIDILFIGFPFCVSNSIVWTCLSVSTKYEID